MELFTHGLLKVYFLHMAQQKPISGKTAVDRIAAISAGKWKPSPGSVYPLLKKLEHGGLLKRELPAKAKGRQLFYSITARGRRELKKQKKHYLLQYSEHLSSLFPLVLQLMHQDVGRELDDIALGFSRALTKLQEMLGEAAGQQ